jgi:hypothetical protein
VDAFRKTGVVWCFGVAAQLYVTRLQDLVRPVQMKLILRSQVDQRTQKQYH